MTDVGATEPVGLVIGLWLTGIVFIYSATFGIGQLLLGNRMLGAGLTVLAAVTLIVIIKKSADLPRPVDHERD